MLAPRLAAPEPEVVVARSETEAIAVFGDGAGITVIGGGTIVTPLLTHGAIWPERCSSAVMRGAP